MGAPKRSRDQFNRLLHLLWASKRHWFFVFLGTTFAVIGGLFAVAQGDEARRIGSVLLAFLSAVAAGSLAGFLFGIPRVLTSSADAGMRAGDETDGPPATHRGGFQHNTNLEQISDWLTKIIVGISLVQAEEINDNLRQVAEELAREWGRPDGVMTAALLLVGSALMGFFATYIWTRTDFAQELERNETDIRKIVRERELIAVLAFAGIPSAPERFGRPGAHGSPAIERNPKVSSSQMSDEFRRMWESDPIKGAFGGSPRAGSLTLGASVSPLAHDASLFGVRLTVTDSQKALTEPVKFHLHPSFDRQTVDVTPVNGVAELKIGAVEAFTVGAEVAGVHLELDLNELPNIPEAFRS